MINISLHDIKHKLEEIIERILILSRWILAPIYVLLIIVLILILFRFVGEVYEFVLVMQTLPYNEWIMRILELLDLTLIANLVLIVALSGYENFISKIDAFDRLEDDFSWMNNLDFSGLKLKIIGSVVAISLIQLLQDFLNVASLDPTTEFWRIMLHLTFVGTALVFTVMQILATKRHAIEHKDELTQMESRQFKDL